MKKFRTTRREMTLGVALAAATLAFAIPASAQDYPSQPIRLVGPMVPAAALMSIAASWRFRSQNS